MINSLHPALLFINFCACAVIAIRLLTYQRNGARYSKPAAVFAYLLIASSGTIAIRIAFGEYVNADPVEVFLNVVLCVATLTARGNVKAFFKMNEPIGEKNDDTE